MSYMEPAASGAGNPGLTLLIHVSRLSKIAISMPGILSRMEASSRKKT